MKKLCIVATIALVALALPAAAAEVAEPNVSPAAATWQATGQHDAVLTVGGPDGFHLQEQIKADGSLSLSLFDKDGFALPDGQYNWQVVATPKLSPSERADLAERRDSVRLETMAESGSFRIEGGAFVDPGVGEAQLALKDIQHLDDVIIAFSLCVGNDCVNGESFGFDTIRLKENNLRINFADTSNSASFPTNDWRIVINDTSNGGGNYFAVEDSNAGRQVFRVDAGAPTNALYVDSGGDLGLGTNTPVVNLHIKEGNTPTVRLEQDGSSGFTAQTWDLAGNEANFFIRDATNGSKLPFRIEPGAPSNAIYVDGTGGSGNVGLGTTSPAGQLHVSDSGNVLSYFQSSNNNAVQIRLRSSSNNRRIIADSGTDGAQQTQLVFGDAGNFQFLGETATSGVCLLFRDSDDAGDTHCTFLDGAINCASGACP